MSFWPEPVVEKPFHDRMNGGSDEYSEKSVNLHRLPRSLESRQVIRVSGNLSNKGIILVCAWKITFRYIEKLMKNQLLVIGNQTFIGSRLRMSASASQRKRTYFQWLKMPSAIAEWPSMIEMKDFLHKIHIVNRRPNLSEFWVTIT